jgi:hypothetical protein
MFERNRKKYSHYHVKRYLSHYLNKYDSDITATSQIDFDLKIPGFIVYLFYTLINKDNAIKNIVAELDKVGLIKTYHEMLIQQQKIINPIPLLHEPSYLSVDDRKLISHLSSYAVIYARQMITCFSKYRVTYSENDLIKILSLLIQLILINYKPMKFLKFAKDNNDRLHNFRIECATLTIDYFGKIDKIIKIMMPAQNGLLLVYLNTILEPLY